MTSTNKLAYGTPAQPILMTGSQSVNEVIEKLENALLSYEMTLSSATGEGIDVSSKEIDYKWTYVSSVFFTSTVITTVGKKFWNDLSLLRTIIKTLIFRFYLENVLT